MNLGLDIIKPAIVSIDCHRGHLDPSVATMPAAPETAERLTRNNREFFTAARRLSVPIFHIVTTYRSVEEIRSNPFWRTRAEDPNATRKNVLRHNLAGSPGCTIMPGLFEDGDVVVDTKKRYDCFQGTDLDISLRARGVNTLLMTGINTNSCVLATACAANVRDYAVVVVEDCVDTMDSPEHHAAALLCLRTAFAHVLPSQAALDLCASAVG